MTAEDARIAGVTLARLQCGCGPVAESDLRLTLALIDYVSAKYERQGAGDSVACRASRTLAGELRRCLEFRLRPDSQLMLFAVFAIDGALREVSGHLKGLVQFSTDVVMSGSHPIGSANVEWGGLMDPRGASH